jgi:hypothetical protein
VLCQVVSFALCEESLTPVQCLYVLLFVAAAVAVAIGVGPGHSTWIAARFGAHDG